MALRDLPRLFRAIAAGYPETRRRQALQKREQFRGQLRQRVRPFLDPGESIDQVFPARWPSPRLIPLEKFVRQHLLVAVTDRVVVIFRFDPNTWQPRKLEARLPRRSRLGPVSDASCSPVNLPGRRIWVDPGYAEDVRAADAPVGPLDAS